jgi:FkbM family methyltransferase
MLNNRPLWLIRRNVLRSRNYKALLRMTRVYEHPLMAAFRYFLGRGSYPCAVNVNTPAGLQAITLFNSHDAITVHEIFCRGDYNCPTPPQVVIDLGSNIGVSAIYFLTNTSSAFCELYEPDPRNIAKLMQNLKGFDERFALHETAVADREGLLSFTREPTGRYGSLEHPLDAPSSDRIAVRVEHVNNVLRQALSRHGKIDLLKIDTEGCELATLMAIEPQLLLRIRNIVIEWSDHSIELDGFVATSSCDTIMFSNRQMREDADLG